MTKLTTRLTIRMSPDEYAAIEQFCNEQDLNYSGLFMEAVREVIPWLPARTYRYGGERRQLARQHFRETLQEVRDFTGDI